MIRKGIIFLSLGLSYAYVLGQTEIRGRVVDRANKPIALVNIYPIGTFDGSSTDSLGYFAFSTKAPYPIRLVASHLDYQSDTLTLNSSRDLRAITFRLDKAPRQMLEEVVVSATTMRIGSRGVRSVMKPMDVYTNPAGGGDLSMSMRQMPGLQDVGDREGFFVRGGAASETEVTIEGIRVPRFFGRNGHYFPTRARFETGMFTGLSLATGGYGTSKQGGLSGLLELDLADQAPSSLSFSISPLFARIGAGYQSPKKRLYIEQGVSLLEGSALKLMLKPDYNFLTPPRGINYHARLVAKPSDWDEMKALLMVKYDKLALSAQAPFAEGQSEETYRGRNAYVFGLARWRHYFADGRTKATLGLGASLDRNHLDVLYPAHPTRGIEIAQREVDWQGRGRIDTRLGEIRLSSGIDYTYARHTLDHSAFASIPHLKHGTSAVWSEALVPIGQRFSIEGGLRWEYSSLLESSVLLPRLALAFKAHRGATLSLDLGQYAAYGDYYATYGTIPSQREQAKQINLTYQWQPNQTHLLRLQVYEKHYSGLFHLTSRHGASNTGKGYARGIDIFYKSSGLVRGLEHWISYTYTDAKRNYLHTKGQERPDFVARHTASLVMKYWCAPISSQLNMALSYRSGMPMHNPNRSGDTYYNDEHDQIFSLSLSYNYPFKWKRILGVAVASVQNLFNSDPTYGYRYAPTPDERGIYRSVRITTPYRQFYMLGLFFSISVDRRKEIMNGTNL